MFDDFYDEPSEFEAEICEFKAALREAVKREFLEKMAALEKENASLREFRDKKQEYDRELAKMRREYDAAMASAKREAERMRANDIVRTLCSTGYRPKAFYTERPKCDRCNERRQIVYISPMGRKCTEDCKCAKKYVHYEPKEVALFQFGVRRGGLGSQYFERTEEDRDFDSYSFIANLYERNEEKAFDKVNSWNVVFEEEANCKAYCDWRNEQERAEQGGLL